MIEAASGPREAPNLRRINTKPWQMLSRNKGVEATRERRRFVRFDVRKIVAYEVPDEMIRGKSLSENLSPGGIRLRLLTELKPGTGVKMKIGIFGERQPFLATGCVVWQKEVIEDGKRHLKTGVNFSERG